MSNSYFFTEYGLKRFIVGSVAFVARLLSLQSAISSTVSPEIGLKRFIVGSVAFVARLLSLQSAISSTVSPEIGVTLVFGVGCKYLLHAK